MAATTSGGGAVAGASPSRRDKVRAIFDRFDANSDGGLDRTEMAALVSAVNPSVLFTSDQISAILDEVFRSYSDFVPHPSIGLSLPGLLQTYDDGAGDVDRDFAALSLDRRHPHGGAASSSSPSTPRGGATTPLWAASPNHGITQESTWNVVEELETLIRSKIKASAPQTLPKDPTFIDASSEHGWSTELTAETERNRAFVRDESSAEFRAFLKELKEIRVRVDSSPTAEEAIEGHMAIGRTLYDRRLFPEALESFRRAAELRPSDARPHFRAGNACWSLGRLPEAKESYLRALEAAESDSGQLSSLLPQIHINLGIVMEGEGLLINASEHYREAAILCPTHYRALKLLGSALYGAGDYGPAQKSLEEAVLLKPDYADAHCDLGSVRHSLGNEEGAVLAFQTAIDLYPDHLDALYNLGCLFKDVGRHQRAAEMFGRVLAIRPDHWRAQLNRAVSLLGAGEDEEGKKALTQAFKMTNRVELYNALLQLKQYRKNPREDGLDWMVVDESKFKEANKKTTDRKQMSDALWIRELQKATKLLYCDVSALKKEMERIALPVSNTVSERSVKKAELEIILRKLLSTLKPETFQFAVKAINQKIMAALDVTGSGKLDLGMFFAVAAPICGGAPEKRKRAAFNALLWRPVKDVAINGQLAKMDAYIYLKYLRVIYFPSRGFSDLMESGEEDNAAISFPEFLQMFDDMDCGFGIMGTLLKLEAGDRVRRGKHSCKVCRYKITGLMFKEKTSRFNLCSSCYSEGKVPSDLAKEEYMFKEYRVE